MTVALAFDRDDIAVVLGGLDPASAECVIRTGTATFDASYPTNGEAITAAMWQLTRVDFVQFTSAAGKVTEWDYTAGKAKVFISDNNNSSDGPLVEASDTSDQSAHAPRFLVVGAINLTHEGT